MQWGVKEENINVKKVADGWTLMGSVKDVLGLPWSSFYLVELLFMLAIYRDHLIVAKKC